MYQIALDGPSGAGKSSVARILANRLLIVYLDTGAMYRAVGLKAARTGIAFDDESEILRLMDIMALDIRFTDEGQRVFLDGEDISEDIRTNEISLAASAVSALEGVRKRLVAMQQQMAADSSVVMDGRDIGTVVLPDAKYKFYIIADIKERAKRRYLELLKKGKDDKSFDEIEKEMAQRDYQDSNREHSPLKKADDALEIDTTGLSLDEVIEKILAIIEN